MCDNCDPSGTCPDRLRAEEVARDRARIEIEAAQAAVLRSAIAAEPVVPSLMRTVLVEVAAAPVRSRLVAAPLDAAALCSHSRISQIRTEH